MDGEGLPLVLSEIGVRYLYVPVEPWRAGSCWSCCSREQRMREIGAGVAPENTEPQAVSAWEVTQGLASGRSIKDGFDPHMFLITFLSPLVTPVSSPDFYSERDNSCSFFCFAAKRCGLTW